jgi:hypothetical protein
MDVESDWTTQTVRAVDRWYVGWDIGQSLS